MLASLEKHVSEKSTDVVGVSFDENNSTLTVYSGRSSAETDEVVKDVVTIVKDLNLDGGPVVKINGALTASVAVAIVATLGRKFSATAVYNPFAAKYLICASSNPDYIVGTYLE